MDIHRLRAETPGCAERVHLNNAGASLMPAPVVSAVRSHLDLEARIGGYEAAAMAAADIQGAYQAIARLLGTAEGNVAFTEHATAAFVQALSSVPFQSGDVLLTTRNDYVSNQIQYLALAERFGIEVVRAPDELLRELDAYTRSARYRASSPCFWLELGSGKCRHHELRPVACRWFVPGCSACNDLRRVAGLPSVRRQDPE